MARFLIVKDGTDGALEYRSRGARGVKTGGGWTAKAAEAAKWTSRTTADAALAKAEFPSDGARVFELVATRTRGAPAADKPEKPVKAKAPKATTRQRVPRKARPDPRLRYQCTGCDQPYKTRVEAEKCRCAGAKAARARGVKLPIREMKLAGVGPEVAKRPVRRPTAIAVDAGAGTGEHVVVSGLDEPHREPAERTA